MEDNGEMERFDLDNPEYDKDGLPVIPRISFSVPKQYRKEFLHMMVDEVRPSPGAALMAIFVKFMRSYREEQLVKNRKPEGERRETMTFARPSLTTKDVQSRAQNSDPV